MKSPYTRFVRESLQKDKKEGETLCKILTEGLCKSFDMKRVLSTFPGYVYYE